MRITADPRRGWRLVATVALALGACALGLALVESGLRLLVPATDPAGQLRFEVLSDGLPPLGRPLSRQRQFKNSGDYDVMVAFNRHGLRDDKDLAGAGEADWAVVGDSCCFGWGVEQAERFPDRLGALVGRRVFNLCSPTDLRGYRRLVDHATALGARFGRLIVAVSTDTDIVSYTAPPPPPSPRRWSLTRAKAWLTGHSASYAALTTVVHRVPPLRRAFVAAGLIAEEEHAPGRAIRERAFVDSAEELRALIHHTGGVAVLVPPHGLWSAASAAAEEANLARFRGELTRVGVPALDLSEPLRQSGDPARLYFSHDGHWNPRGHDVVARWLAAQLR